MGHLIFGLADVLACVHCGTVERIAPPGRVRSEGQFVVGHCCPEPLREWKREQVIRVWPRLSIDAVYLEGCMIEDELTGSEAKRLRPQRTALNPHRVPADLINRTAKSLGLQRIAPQTRL